MLFDLRSRRRRRAVQVIYVGLAVLMLGGLVLFGVGAGQQGGLLNAFTNNGSGNGQTSAINAQTKAALKAVKNQPNSAAAWGALIQARYTAAGEGNNFNSTTGVYTAGGKKQLQAATSAWTRYLALTKDNPSIEQSTLMARVFAALAQYSNEATAWEYVAGTQTSAPQPYYCLAVSAYAAKQTRKGDLAAAKAVSLEPKLNRLTLKSTLSSAKTTVSTAQSYAQAC
jgi:hypothetical protein